MNKTVVIYVKAAVAFFIPLAAAVTAGLAPFAMTGATPPSRIAEAIIAFTALSAGATGLGSFLSRSYADHQDEQTTPATPAQPPKP